MTSRPILSFAAFAVLVLGATALPSAALATDHRSVSSSVVAGDQTRAASAGRGTSTSLVYVKKGDIYLAHPNGSRAVVVKKGTNYRWPSMDDNGVIAAEAPDGRRAPDGSRGWSIYRFNQFGRTLSRVSTPVDYSTWSCPTYPSSHVSLSPDGTKVAYDYADCNDGFATWTPATSMKLHVWGSYGAPAWLDNSTMMISHTGTTLTSDQAQIGTWSTGGSASGWATDLADPWATSYHATATRDGTKVALLEDDAADYVNGVPRNVRLVLGTAAGVGQPITRRCSIALPPGQYDGPSWGGVTYASLSFKSDGSALVWDAENGLWHANTQNLSDCSTLKAATWIAGAYDGFFSPAKDKR